MMGAMAEAEGIAGLDTSVAHPARVYNYWLGGKDNFAADREAAEQVIAGNPQVLPGVRGNQRLGAVRQTRRSKAEFSRFFEGLDLLDPGAVPLPEWRAI